MSVASLSRADLLFLRGCRPTRNVVEGLKPQRKCAVLAAQGLVRLAYQSEPMRTLNAPDLRRAMIYTLTEAGKQVARQRLPRK